MEINVKVIKVLQPQSFTSSRDGSNVVKNVFIGETAGQYPKKIAFSVIGEDKFRQMNIVVGQTYNVSFDVESREWKEKWFTECSAWRALCVDGQQVASTQTASPVPSAQPAPQQDDGGGEKKDDLPF